VSLHAGGLVCLFFTLGFALLCIPFRQGHFALQAFGRIVAQAYYLAEPGEYAGIIGSGCRAEDPGRSRAIFSLKINALYNPRGNTTFGLLKTSQTTAIWKVCADSEWPIGGYHPNG
jgi:hypothetical protein